MPPKTLKQIETTILGGETRVSVSQAEGKLGTLVYDHETISWTPALHEDDAEAGPQMSWLLTWQEFGGLMESGDLREIMLFDQSAYARTNRVGALVADADFGSSMPEARAELGLARRFNTAEFALIRKGFPPDWDAHWGMIFDPVEREMRMCRSWTGHCIYILKFREDTRGVEIEQSWVNRDPEQYQETDLGHDRDLASWLIDTFLLGRQSEFPSK